MNIYEINNLRCSFAKIVSYILEAPFLAVPAFFVLNFFLNKENFLLIEFISLLFATIVPVSLVLIWSKIKRVDKDYTIKETRNLPLLIVATIYLVGSFILYLSSANPLTIALMFCYGTNTLIVFLINLKWKISVHSMGVAGPTTFLMFFNPLCFLLGLIGPLIMWSRVTLKKHTIPQVLAGSICGYILTFIQIYYLTKLMHFVIDIDMFLIIWTILGLSLPPIGIIFNRIFE